MAEIFQNREQNIEHVGIYIAAHRMPFSCISGALERPITGMQDRSMWLVFTIPMDDPQNIQSATS